jgi:hypothetical protein
VVGDCIGLVLEILLLQAMALEVLMAVEDFRVEAVEEERVLVGALGCSYLNLDCLLQAFEEVSL